MINYRIKYKNTISELYYPKESKEIAVIFLPGLPSFLGKNNITKKLTEAGCIVYQPYYSGTYDSSGYFTPSQCIKDVDQFIKMANKNKQKELYFNKILRTEAKKIILIGTSFGSSIVAINQNKKVSKKILISPVLTYNQTLIGEIVKNLSFKDQMKGLLRLITKGYPLIYRMNNIKEWREFLFGKNDKFNPIKFLQSNKISEKITIIQGINDSSVPEELNKILLRKFNIHAKFVVDKTAGHSISSYSEKIISMISKEAIND